MSDLSLVIAGQEVPFREFTSKGGNTCWGVLDRKADGSRYLSPYGVPVTALAKQLPNRLDVKAGSKTLRVELESGTTQRGTAKVAHRAKVTLPNGEERMLVIGISLLDGGRWNLIAKAVGIGSGASKTRELSDL